MYRRRLLAPLLAAALFATGPVGAETVFTPEQEEEVGRLVRQYLLEHPEVILEAVQQLEGREQAQAENARAEVIAANYAQLAEDPSSPVLGNPEGDVLLVEFFDYNCSYCRRITEDVFRLVETDGNVRYVMKELPIFGEGSRFAAKAALAAARQGKYAELHYALMTAQSQIDEATTLAVAAEAGLDVEQLRRDMLDPALDSALERNYQLARVLKVEGTPAMVVGTTFVPGARSYADLEALVAAARAGKR